MHFWALETAKLAVSPYSYMLSWAKKIFWIYLCTKHQVVTPIIVTHSQKETEWAYLPPPSRHNFDSAAEDRQGTGWERGRWRAAEGHRSDWRPGLLWRERSLCTRGTHSTQWDSGAPREYVCLNYSSQIWRISQQAYGVTQIQHTHSVTMCPAGEYWPRKRAMMLNIGDFWESKQVGSTEVSTRSRV